MTHAKQQERIQAIAKVGAVALHGAYLTGLIRLPEGRIAPPEVGELESKLEFILSGVIMKADEVGLDDL